MDEMDVQILYTNPEFLLRRSEATKKHFPFVPIQMHTATYLTYSVLKFSTNRHNIYYKEKKLRKRRPKQKLAGWLLTNKMYLRIN